MEPESQRHVASVQLWWYLMLFTPSAEEHRYEHGRASFLNALSRTAHNVALQRFLGTHHVMHEKFVPV